jgi:phosphoenolpyruvate carboxykinase (GTP)
VAHETPIGLVPSPADINTEGLRIEDGALEELLEVDPSLVSEQLPQVEEFLAKFGDGLPGEFRSQLEALKQRLG